MTVSTTARHENVDRTRSRRMTRARRRALSGYLYIGPWLIGFLIFVLGPMVASFWLSFNNYNLIRPPEFVGLQNYLTMFNGTDNDALRS